MLCASRCTCVSSGVNPKKPPKQQTTCFENNHSLSGDLTSLEVDSSRSVANHFSCHFPLPQIRNELETQMNCNLKEFKEFIDNEMLLILGQMDKPSLIFDHLYLVRSTVLGGSGLGNIRLQTLIVWNLSSGCSGNSSLRRPSSGLP